ncbi:MAG: bifunctional hydroxymethylpyrimidine kinase/phosphomethylpyrimidine kinase [Methanomassiliicoccales archaeon]|nr:bifunctional hydroxymethylpyrimidine kinase/phosphomethylpyrimidine kinase [Methanomassiliicoccales archaeon]
MFVVLTIAGSDSIGGAGIQADIKALASMGIHGVSVLTAVTSQNTQHVYGIHPIPVDHIISQLDAIIEDTPIGAIKTGMLYSAEAAQAVAEKIKKLNSPIVVDPVLVAGAGDRLYAGDLIRSLKDDIIPISTVVTPNIPEAEAMTGIRIRSGEDRTKACKYILDMGAKSVLLKGGHLQGEKIIDTLCLGDEIVEFVSRRVEHRGHGGGCILSAYIAGYLATGKTIKEAINLARDRLSDSIGMHYTIGKGMKIVNPMATAEKEAERYTVMKSLKSAVRELESILPTSWVPEVGINFVYALPCARGPNEVCGLEGRIGVVGDRPVHLGCLDFGASKHIAMVVLAAMQHDPSTRSAINIRYHENILACLRLAGLSVASFSRAEEPEGRKTMEWGTDTAIKEAGFVPDVIFDKGGLGKEPMIRVLGKNPSDVIRKIRLALDRAVMP